MTSALHRVKAALEDLQQGKMVILTDDTERENEGDLIIAAEKINQSAMNFMIRQGTGIVCLSLSTEQLHKFQLSPMVPPHESSSLRSTPFTVSIDAKEGITTGVSAPDRTRTIDVIMNEHSTKDDIVKPGHIFPLHAKDGGVFERQGHTEGAVDLARLAGFKPAAVLCEIMNPDGTMAQGPQLIQFAEKHQLKTLSIEDIIIYRSYHENLIADEASSYFPLEKYGVFKITVVKEKISGMEHVILTKEKKSSHPATLVRIHSSCLTGDLFSSSRCDCYQQLHYSLQKISEEGGILIYLNQEGRGIGLFNKIKAYALQEKGYDTVEANQQLGLPIDSRNYYFAANILRYYNMTRVRLLTNNPNKLIDLKKYGISQVEQITMPSFHHEHNHFYLTTKKEKLHHTIHFNSPMNTILKDTLTRNMNK